MFKRRKKSKQDTDIVATLDLGSSKICTIVAEMSASTQRIIGMGHQASKGIRSGLITDMNEAEEAILNLIYL